VQSIGTKIKKIADLRGLSMTAISKSTGIPSSTLSEIINGKHKNLSIQKLFEISKFLECDLNYLFDDRAESENTGLKLGESELTLLGNYNKLNQPAQKRLLETSEDLVANRKNLKNNDTAEFIELSAELA